MSHSTLALIGGEEFAAGFEIVHAELIGMLGKPNPRVVFLPTAASHDGAIVAQEWCERAKKLLGDAGAIVDAPLVIDKVSANEESNAALLDNADMIYLGGGFPHILIETLEGTRTLDAFWRAVERGALIAGASAGAMAMGARSMKITPDLLAAVSALWGGGTLPDDWQPPPLEFFECWNLVPRVEVSPHFDQVPVALEFIKRGLFPKQDIVIGIDEQTALVGNGDAWRVLGRGAVTIARNGELEKYRAGDVLKWN